MKGHEIRIKTIEDDEIRDISMDHARIRFLIALAKETLRTRDVKLRQHRKEFKNWELALFELAEKGLKK